MKTMGLPGYHYNGFVATHAHGIIQKESASIFDKKVPFFPKRLLL